jgi:hypothetical protein
LISNDLPAAANLQNSGQKVHPNSDPSRKENHAKNKVQFGGVFFDAKLVTTKPPHLPRITPQIHHQTTTFCTSLLPKPPAKTHIHQRRKKRREKHPFARNFLGRKCERPGAIPAFRSSVR